ANGTVYSVDLAAGDMIATGPSSFIFESPSAGFGGGVGLLKIRRSLQGPSLIVFKCYGDLSAATLSHMKATLTIGDQEFRSEGDWRQTPMGWFGAHFERQAPWAVVVGSGGRSGTRADDAHNRRPGVHERGELAADVGRMVRRPL